MKSIMTLLFMCALLLALRQLPSVGYNAQYISSTDLYNARNTPVTVSCTVVQVQTQITSNRRLLSCINKDLVTITLSIDSVSYDTSYLLNTPITATGLLTANAFVSVRKPWDNIRTTAPLRREVFRLAEILTMSRKGNAYIYEVILTNHKRVELYADASVGILHSGDYIGGYVRNNRFIVTSTN